MNMSAQEERNLYVVKSNDLIRQSRYNLTLQQQRIILYAISKIRPSDTVNTKYTFHISDLCATCGLELDTGGYYYESIKSDIKELTKREWLTFADGSEKTISWIGDAEIEPYNGKVSITFNSNMKPYLFELKQRYTQYKLENVLCFSSTFSIRLYELLRSYTTQALLDDGIERTQKFSIEELHSYLGLEGKYQAWGDFDRYVIRKSIAEINKTSGDINISYKTEKAGRRIESVIFSIKAASFVSYMDARREREKKLENESARKQR